MKKNTKRTRFQSLDAAQLAQVTGGASAQWVAAATNLVDLSSDWAPGSGWSEFFFAAATP